MSNLQANAGVTEKRRYWYALYTRARFEKMVAAELKQKGYESFLPLHSVVRYWSDRLKTLQEPLFPSYVFVHANEKERYYSLQSRGVIRMVSFNSRPARIPDEQIQAISRILCQGYNPQPHHYLNVGDEVEVISGPLTGIRGFFVEERSQQRLIISVHAIRQSLAIELQRNQVRKVRPVSTPRLHENCNLVF